MAKKALLLSYLPQQNTKKQTLRIYKYDINS